MSSHTKTFVIYITFVNTYIYIFDKIQIFFQVNLCSCTFGWLVKYVSCVSKLLIVMDVYLWMNGATHGEGEWWWWSIKWKRCREFSDSI